MSDRPHAPTDLARLATLDFEASCYPDAGKSFPVEVAVCRVTTDVCRAWLIAPHEAWAGWTWDPGAEAVHHLSRERLARDGQPAEAVLEELAAFVDGLSVVSDSRSDDVWLQVLAEAAGRPVPFRIASFTRLLKDLDPADPDRFRASCKRIEAQALALHPEQHRAGPDARRLAEMIRLTAKG